MKLRHWWQRLLCLVGKHDWNTAMFTRKCRCCGRRQEWIVFESILGQEFQGWTDD
jgi:hypothetical protein